MGGAWFEVAYLVAIILFISGIKQLGKVRTAKNGNRLASLAMLLVVIGAVGQLNERSHGAGVDWGWIIAGVIVGGGIGAVVAKKVQMTEMPEMVALFNGSGGAASVFVVLSFLANEISTTLKALPDSASLADAMGWDTTLALALSILIGGVTLTGSVVAYGKLSGKVTGDAVVYDMQHQINGGLILAALVLTALIGWVLGPGAAMSVSVFLALLSLGLGVLLVLPIGGADMPVVISLLNSYSGIAAAMTGFVLKSPVLIVSGALVGASGLILTNIMCKAMNRSLLSVLLGGFGQTAGSGSSEDAREYSNVKSVGPEELAMMLEGVSSVIFVPGYGLAVAQAQHVTRELGDFLEAQGAQVKYAIHPVAGRMPGHMNVLLAEASVPYEQLVEMDEINPEFKSTDVVIVLGANDVVNPAALDDPESPLAGMPILNVHDARQVIVVKRSLSPGYAGVRNPLFEADNAHMLFSDAKVALQETLNELKETVGA
ncbi:MAG: NAD(P)(+) transhydrogenase (Re/Si-specific) subunit beta [Planctomycetota bacterium]|nr:NAD(P)(+) transhydrogenase (Re/Si-specific) subunit beta [Planctomycetota bacterium]